MIVVTGSRPIVPMAFYKRREITWGYAWSLLLSPGYKIAQEIILRAETLYFVIGDAVKVFQSLCW